MDYPKITVVSPSYNQGEFLEECITSVLEQNYPNLEYFVIDGGSSDNSKEVIEQYAEHIDYWVSEKDNGQSDAINKGFKRATGDLVVWLNSDDFFMPNALEVVAKAYNSNPNASFYFGDGIRVERDRTPKENYFPNGVHFDFLALFHGLNYILQPSSFISRRHIALLGFVNEKLNYAMDTDLWLRLSLLAPPQTIQVILAASREYGETKTSTGLFKRIEEIRLLMQKYTGEQITPGVFCYLMHAIHTCITQPGKETIYPSTVVDAVNVLWGEFSNIVKNISGTVVGTPIRDYVPHRYYLEEEEHKGLSVEDKLTRYQGQMAVLHTEIERLKSRMTDSQDIENKYNGFQAALDNQQKIIMQLQQELVEARATIGEMTRKENG